ncbi:MAG: NADPH-dependent F420 reductase [Candidatus Terraquivivens tikiterensis]|uniref:NADPH-dependent F420 reductase n=1 Tax=Candidatus Terraquivivens tikiterensis TaxID=1980982 RepID=A0A2R7Y3K3_9ARCH|nr:MAG: NADPH-dependent F420 reductase [Candidatus Terraquivivens tikiterensis]
MKIALLGGTGDQGLGLALRFCKAGMDVVIGSRSMERALEASKNVKSRLGGVKIEGMLNEDAAKVADVVFLTVPLIGLIPTLKAIANNVRGKVVVSPVVPLEAEIGGTLRPIRLWSGSVAELVAERLKDSKVVAAFHNVSAEALSDLEKPVECDVVVCSDHDDARQLVMQLAEKIDGVRPIDGGPLSNSRFVEELTSLLLFLNKKYSVKSSGVRFTGLGGVTYFSR